MKKTVAGLLIFFFITAFRTVDLNPFPLPEGWPKPVYNFKKNPLDNAKIELGRLLFYDPVLSRDSTISCGSCHLSFTAFTHTDHDLSHGIEGRIGTRNSPALMNLAWSESFMWDGAITNLDFQARTPICNPDEMDETMEHVVKKLQLSTFYPGLFYRSFGDSVIRTEYLLQSISQFMLTLVSANAKYDRMKRGEERFNEYENKGYILFKQHCNSCHREPLFTNGKFENNGLLPDPMLNDAGRVKISSDAKDSFRFKVPTLRNIQYSYPYMHDGRFKNLGQVLNHYSMGIRQAANLSPALKKGIYLTAQEKGYLVAFLLTLTDREFLFDPRFSYPEK